MARFLRNSFGAVSALTLLAAGAPSRADIVLPTSAFSGGANLAEFHTDVRIFNPGTSPVNVIPIFYNQASGETVTKPFFTVPARAQMAFDNVLQSLFGQTLGSFGPIRFQTSAPIIVSSGTNNVNSCGNGSTSGQWIPGIDAGQALKTGTLVQLAGSINPLTGYRSNLVFMNPGTGNATVRAKLRRGDGTLVADVTLDPLGPNGWRQINRLDVFLGNPNTITDTNLWLEFTSDQPVLSFASVINNASGDPFAVTATAELSAPVLAPVASYTVSASPTAGQAVTFTDTSSNSPVNRFWTFGDGATLVGAGAATTTQHTYTTAGTYHTALFVDNSAGASATAKDVTVAASGPIAITITGSSHGDTKWDWTPSPVTLKVGQAYVLTFRADPAETHNHGIGGLAFLGITQCDLIAPTHPCVVNFTPTASMVGGSPWQYACTQTNCAPSQALHDGMTGVIVIAP